MSNWDLMMPGMGLTAIGLTGVTISFAGIAHTFIDGMHALTGLTMIIGMIFLSAGILDGGVSTSNKAKATTLVILAISLSFGVASLIFNSISSIPTFAGVMLIVIIPAIVMAYVAMKMPQYAKPVSVIFVLATGAAIAAYVGFGLYGPSQYLVPPPEVVEEKKEIVPTAPIFAISILKDSATQGNPDFDPDIAKVPTGNIIRWTNNDAVVHTVTGLSETHPFDSSSITAGGTFDLDTSKFEPGTYDYMCAFHPYMTGSFVIGSTAQSAPEFPISILKDSSIQGNPDYDPDMAKVSLGNTIVWTNNDVGIHTVTSSVESPKSFDSSTIKSGESFRLDISTFSPGKYDYSCSFHPWMTASFEIVNESDMRLTENATVNDPNSTPDVAEMPMDIPTKETPVEETKETPPAVIEKPAETSESSESIVAPSESITVEMAEGSGSNQNCGDECFIPSTVHVLAGDTVTWKNTDSAAHTATEMNNKFDSQYLMVGKEYSYKFENVGTYEYMCIVHPWMKGTVIVE